MTALDDDDDDRRHSGVLWKRRDVFKNRWRPRWFVLSPQQGTLTYYLLSSSSSNGHHNKYPTTTTTMDASSMSRRTDDSNTVSSYHTLDYDVVPRGTIFLLGCTIVSKDDFEFTTSEQHQHPQLYAFSIRPPSSSSSSSTIHLAARTAAARAEWVERLTRVAQQRRFRRWHSSPAAAATDDPTTMRANSTVTAAIDDKEQTTAVLSNEEPPAPWTTVGPIDALHQGLADDIIEQLSHKLDHYLPLSDTTTTTPRKQLFSQPHASAYQIQSTDTSSMVVESHRTFLEHSPAHVLRTLLDLSARPQYETNLQASRRVQVLNSHTWMDYYAYRGVSCV